MTDPRHYEASRPGHRQWGRALPVIVLVSTATLSLGLVAALIITLVVQPFEQVLRSGLGADPDRPQYDITAEVDPATGRVTGQVGVRVPSDIGGDTLRFRVVPNAEDYDSSFRTRRVTVDGDTVDARLTDGLLTVPRGGTGAVEVTIDFAYTVVKGQTSPLAALGLAPSDEPLVAGLLARYDTGLSMGHWYPFLVADGASASASLPEVGDVGNAPACDVRAKITVPKGYQVISGGDTKDVSSTSGKSVVEERAFGIRELSLVISDQLEATTKQRSGIEVKVWAPADASDEADEVADITTRALGVFNDSFGRYAWRSLDVVQAPMPPGVGGMEWQGMFWVGSELFRGQLPGLPTKVSELFGSTDVMADTREFTVVHELAHQWWQGMVGVDQTTHEVVDEPLAQYSSCLYFAETRPSDWREVCDQNTSINYRYMRTMGVPDAPADQPTKSFAGDKQYAGVVYGKAPNYYRALEKLEGRRAVLAGLRQLVEDRSTEIVQPDDVVSALQDHAPADNREQVAALWRHWMDERHGDDDVGTEVLP